MNTESRQPAGAAAGTDDQVLVLDGHCTATRDVIGGKAWGVNRMRALGLPVPPAVVITTNACRDYFRQGRVLDERLWAQVVDGVRVLEAGSGRRFGAAPRPLLVSVRSGAAHSMPGMMDTVLDLGINDELAAALAEEHGQSPHIGDSHRRFVAQFRKVVLGGRNDPVPQDPWIQLRRAIAAVFDSWCSPRAQLYRSDRGLSDDTFTAVTIQAMVFGNADAHSGTGVLFSRNPLTGDPPAWGEWLPRGQGEDVVSGARTPLPLDALRIQMADVYAQLMRASALLEADAADIQDIEFTVESGHLWLLQTRVAKRSVHAALRAAVAFAEEGLITREAALLRLHSAQVRALPRLQLSESVRTAAVAARGEAASPGIAHGIVVLDASSAQACKRRGQAVVLALPNTSPEDLPGVVAADGVITEQGGSTSHAAVVCRELARPCVVGCGADSVTRLAGEHVTLDGASGCVWRGNLVVEQSDLPDDADSETLFAWGAPLIALRLVSDRDDREAVVDLDRYGEDWRAALVPGARVRGAVLDTDEGIVAALDAGVDTAIVRQRLPALLACLRHDRAEHVQRAAASPDAMLDDLTLLRLIGLKGRAGAALLGEALGVSAAQACTAYTALGTRGFCTSVAGQFLLTTAGHARLKALLALERSGVDREATMALYRDFEPLDAQVKQLLTDWQVKPGGVLNDHLDDAYDAHVIERLRLLHDRVSAFLPRAEHIVPRLSGYRSRLERAAARVEAGSRGYLAKIASDSYHAIWFELHEELLGLAGMTRADIARQRA